MNPIAHYVNGNTNVTIFSDGTKVREYEDIPSIVHPESIDVKITDYCDLGCEYCHESSTRGGKHADLNKLLSIIKDLPAGVELAIGGGNPLSHPELITFLTKLKEKGIIANITVNQGHLKPFQELLERLILQDLVKGIGVSITSNNFTYVKRLLDITDNVVYHMIAGVNTVDQLSKLIDLHPTCKVLLLGYKYFGFGVNYHDKSVDTNVKEWYRLLPTLIGKCVISFDNLAIEQLKVRRIFTSEGWDKFYMGDDFVYTMYIDAVKQEYAPTSRSKQRTSFTDTTLLEYFSKRPCTI